MTMSKRIRTIEDLVKNFWSKVDIRSDNECWNWKAGTVSGGYGIATAYLNGKQDYAHRVAFNLTNGYLPTNGRVIMHSCDNKICCNPKHLIDGTQGENVSDAVNKGLITFHNSTKTVCSQGHDLTDPENVHWYQGHRRCRACDRLRRH